MFVIVFVCLFVYLFDGSNVRLLPSVHNDMRRSVLLAGTTAGIWDLLSFVLRHNPRGNYTAAVAKNSRN